MKLEVCDVDQTAVEKRPASTGDKSGIGVQYVDAYLKPINTVLEDGACVKCKRRGLIISLAVGDQKGDGLMRRLDVSRAPVAMLDAALQEAAKAAEVALVADNGVIYVEFA